MIGLEFICANKGMQYKELAEKIDVSRQSITNWVTGRNKIPTNHCMNMSKVFGNIPSEWFNKELSESDKVILLDLLDEDKRKKLTDKTNSKRTEVKLFQNQIVDNIGKYMDYWINNNDTSLLEVGKEKLELFKISGVTGEGISELLNRVSEVLKTLPKEEIVEEEDKVIYTLDDDKEEFTVRKDGDTFVVEGKAVNRLMGRINIDDNESMYYFQKKLKELGIEDELKRQGICEGDYVKMLNWTFEWYQ